MTPPDRAFFARPADIVAPALLGCVLCRTIDGTPRRARIIETEAYLGPRDLASHSSKGRTARTEVMFGPPGHAYVYFIYGMHWMLNVTAGQIGHAHAVLIRAAEPLDDWSVDLTGPGKLARAFAITRADNTADLLAHDLQLMLDPSHRPRIRKTRRIGIDYAKHWKTRLLRYIDTTSPVTARLPRPRA